MPQRYCKCPPNVRTCRHRRCTRETAQTLPFFRPSAPGSIWREQPTNLLICRSSATTRDERRVTDEHLRSHHEVRYWTCTSAFWCPDISSTTTPFSLNSASTRRL